MAVALFLAISWEQYNFMMCLGNYASTRDYFFQASNASANGGLNDLDGFALPRGSM